ncbi:MAG: VCBS repeat-containing protein [Planctomycetes bacterium]|nr:VCBS repeat-containing protein [Planctomycetota bacterium]
MTPSPGFPTYNTSANLKFITLGDLSGDGKPDVLAANSSGSSASALLGDGAGAFAASLIKTISSLTNTVAIGDLNADGKPDMVAVAAASKVFVALGNGNGTFGTVASYNVGTTPLSVAIADLNADGKLDLVVANSASNTVSVLLGNGNSTFAAQVTYATGTQPVSVAIGDPSNDGIPDIVTANKSAHNISILIGVGDGTFLAAVNIAVGTAPWCVVLGDLNLNGSTDVIAVDNAIDKVSRFLGNGDGTLGTKSDFLTINSPTFGVIGDLNGDGIPDVAVGTDQAFPGTTITGQIGVLIGDGSGDFVGASGPGAVVVAFPVGLGGGSLALSDLNGDGRNDLVTANTNNSNISVLLNQTLTPTGLAVYGVGTPGCAGILGIGANAMPKVNSPNFKFIGTNVPPNSLGLLLVTNSQDFAGSDPFAVGITLHVDFFSATEVYSLDAYSEVSGVNFSPAPIPNNPLIIGNTYFAQGLWVEDAANGHDCSPGQYHLESSRGLMLTIQP